MKQGKRTKRKNKIIEWYGIMLFLGVLLISIAYAQIAGQQMNVEADVAAEAQDGVFITGVISQDTTNGKINYYQDTLLSSQLTLENSSSTVTYEITLYNNSSEDYVYIGELIDENAYSNENIGYTINGLTKGVTTIAPKASLTFTITFAFKDGTDTTNNVLESIINFRFKELPIIDLSNEGQTYTIENAAPGMKAVAYEFIVQNYTQEDTNYVPMKYHFETTINSPLQAKIYDEDGNEVTGEINLKADGKTEEHTYTLKIMWNANDTEFDIEEALCNVKLIAKPTDEKYEDYDEKYEDYEIVKEFNVNINIQTELTLVSAEDDKTGDNITTQFTIKMLATDPEKDNLTYTLYYSEYKNGSFTKVGSVTAPSGEYTSIIKSGLKEYTVYWWYVTVTDGTDTVTSEVKAVNTCCSGTGTGTATLCPISGTLCASCGGVGDCGGVATESVSTSYPCWICGDGVMEGVFISCPAEFCDFATDQVNCETCHTGDGFAAEHTPVDCPDCENGYSGTYSYCEDHGDDTLHFYCSKCGYVGAVAAHDCVCEHGASGVHCDMGNVEENVTISDISSDPNKYKGAIIYGYDPNVASDGSTVGASYNWPTNDGYVFNSNGYTGIWRILGIEGNNIQITTSAPVYPTGTTSFRLGDGSNYYTIWNNYQTYISQACAIYGNGKYALSGSSSTRSMLLSDLGLTDDTSKETLPISASTNLITDLYKGENKTYFLYDKFEDVSYCNHSGAYFGEYYVSGADMSVARNICVAEYYDENDEFQLDYNYLSNVYGGLRPVIALESSVELELIGPNTYKIVGSECTRHNFVDGVCIICGAEQTIIPISTADQLLKIGSNGQVTIDGKNYTFTADAYYDLQNDITFSVKDYSNQYPNAFKTEATTIEEKKSYYETANTTSNPYYTYTALATGTYKLEVWGAQGGTYNSSYGKGGRGGYSVGTITLDEGDNLYVYVGGKGSYGTTTTYDSTNGGGYNGGGAAGYRGGTGGGATDIRFKSGTWNDSSSLLSRVIVAGGGGGAYAYSSSYKADGGYGGGTTGGSGLCLGYGASYTKWVGGGGTQTAGGTAGTGSSTDYNGKAGTFGTGGNTGYKGNSTSYYSNGAGRRRLVWRRFCWKL